MCISRKVKNESLDAVQCSVCKPEMFPNVSFWSPAASSSDSDHHHVVIHNYHDHLNDDDVEVGSSPSVKGGVTTAFPLRLHELLDQIEDDGLAHVVSWQPHGRCFVVHDHKEFTEKVMPAYFKQSKFASFQRQLNLYGFNRLTKGPDKGGYYHELFLRGKKSLTLKIHRMKIKGTGVRARSNPSAEPNFYSMSPVIDNGRSITPEFTTSMSHQTPLETFSVPFDGEKSVHFDDTVLFEGRPFHFIEPEVFAERSEIETFSEDEMDSSDYLRDILNISRHMFSNILDDVDTDYEFGCLLEKVLA